MAAAAGEGIVNAIAPGSRGEISKTAGIDPDLQARVEEVQAVTA